MKSLFSRTCSNNCPFDPEGREPGVSFTKFFPVRQNEQRQVDWEMKIKRFNRMAIGLSDYWVVTCLFVTSMETRCRPLGEVAVDSYCGRVTARGNS